MSNIIVYDDWKGKFSNEIIKHWRSEGHKVLFDPPWEAMTQADLTFFYQASNTAIEGVGKPHTGKIYVQAVDIEVHVGQAQAVDWTKVDKALFMAQHIKDKVNIGTTPYKIIKPGVDPKQWPLCPVKGSTSDSVRKMVYLVGDRRIWDVKRFDIALQLLYDCLAISGNIWQLHVRGSYSSHEQYNTYCKHLIKDLKLENNIFWYENRIDNLSTFLDDKDYFILPSTKEAFSYATAETMSKGIKPILNNWEGAKDTWGKYVCNTYGEMLAELTRGEHTPTEYRSFVEEHYSQDRYFAELDAFFEIETIKDYLNRAFPNGGEVEL